VILLNITRFASNDEKEGEEGHKTQCKIMLNSKSVESICQILAINNLQVKTMTKISNIIAIFCLQEENLNLFIEELKRLIVSISRQLNQIITENMKMIK